MRCRYAVVSMDHATYLLGGDETQKLWFQLDDVNGIVEGIRRVLDGEIYLSSALGRYE